MARSLREVFSPSLVARVYLPAAQSLRRSAALRRINSPILMRKPAVMKIRRRVRLCLSRTPK